MRYTLILAVLLTAFAGTLAAQVAANPTLTSDDTNKTNTHDRPVGSVRMKLPAPPVADTVFPPPPPPPPPPPGGDDIPPEEQLPPPPPEDPPTYYDEPCQGKIAFLLDASGSMYGSRIASVRVETANVIALFTKEDEFDACAYGDQHGYPTYTRFMWGALLPGTDGNKAAAINWVNGPATNPGGGTPTLPCLRVACTTYPADLDKMFLLTDGSPNTGGTAGTILSEFPTLWSHFTDCTLVCVCIGGVGSAQSFMQSLAALAGGTYIQR